MASESDSLSTVRNNNTSSGNGQQDEVDFQGVSLTSPTTNATSHKDNDVSDEDDDVDVLLNELANHNSDAWTEGESLPQQQQRTIPDEKEEALNKLRESTSRLSNTWTALTTEVDSRLNISNSVRNLDSQLHVSETVSNLWNSIAPKTRTVTERTVEASEAVSKPLAEGYEKSGVHEIITNANSAIKNWDHEHQVTIKAASVLAESADWLSKNLSSVAIHPTDKKDEEDYESLIIQQQSIEIDDVEGTGLATDASSEEKKKQEK